MKTVADLLDDEPDDAAMVAALERVEAEAWRARAARNKAAALAKLTVAKLRARLKKKGLDTPGKKAVLVERLAAALDEAAPLATSLEADKAVASSENPDTAAAAAT